MRNLAIIAIAVLAGCSNTTETGYKPRRLGDSRTVQRGYYAPAYSPAQRAAEEELRLGNDPRSRPGLDY
jgi:hypothetical protein